MNVFKKTQSINYDVYCVQCQYNNDVVNPWFFFSGLLGSGKSYTMMGTQENNGIIPRLCDSLFDLIAKQQTSELMYKVEVSYMEIYNEKVSIIGWKFV